VATVTFKSASMALTLTVLFGVDTYSSFIGQKTPLRALADLSLKSPITEKKY